MNRLRNFSSLLHFISEEQSWWSSEWVCLNLGTTAGKTWRFTFLPLLPHLGNSEKLMAACCFHFVCMCLCRLKFWSPMAWYRASRRPLQYKKEVVRFHLGTVLIDHLLRQHHYPWNSYDQVFATMLLPIEMVSLTFLYCSLLNFWILNIHSFLFSRIRWWYRMKWKRL